MADTNIYVHVVRNLWRALISAMIAIFLAAPAVAWDMHSLAHSSTPVSVTEHHHHHGDGSTHSDHSPADQSQGEGDAKRGHDHSASLSAAWTGTLPLGPTMLTPSGAEPPRFAIIGHAPPDFAPAPQIRPPRFA